MVIGVDGVDLHQRPAILSSYCSALGCARWSLFTLLFFVFLFPWCACALSCLLFYPDHSLFICLLSNHFNTRVFLNLTFAPAYPVSLISCWHGLCSCCISVHFTGLIPFISLFIVVWTCALSWWSSSVIYPLATMDWSMTPKSAWLWLCLWIIPCTFAGLDWSLGADLLMTTHLSCALYLSCLGSWQPTVILLFSLKTQ